MFLNVGAEDDMKTGIKRILIIPPSPLIGVMFIALSIAKLRVKISGGKGRDYASKNHFCSL